MALFISYMGRPRTRESELGGCWPSVGAAQTARRTWEAFAISPTRECALACLACLKGFYLNFYPAPLHCDSDNYLESWTLRWLAEQASTPAFSDTSPNAGATVLPLRGLAIHTRPECDVTHAFFKHEEHGAWDSGGMASSRGSPARP